MAERLMTDAELFEWLAKNGTEISREELEREYWRVEQALAAREKARLRSKTRRKLDS